jgi:aspartate/methionine/tyrosine aminotransferase
VGPSARGRVAPFYVMEVAKAAAARQASHGDVIGLYVGQPATAAPLKVRERAGAAVADEVLGYTVTNGIEELRRAIAADYARAYGQRVGPEEVFITTGSSSGFLLAALAAFDVGDQVAMVRPGYPAYRNALISLGVEVIELEAGPQSRFQPTVEMLASLPSVPAGLVVASPSNPTGTIIDVEELRRLASWCEAHGCRLISDEIYHGISFGRECATARQFSTEAIIVGSVSKYHSMTGWRLGWLIVPPELRQAVENLQANLAICAPAISQVAAVAAFSDAARIELDDHVARYARNRDLLLRRLPEIGLTEFAPPDGAFYCYCDISEFTDDSLRWCEDVLAATGVALAPGIDFDPVGGAHTMRLSFCGQTAELDQALDRLATYLRR